MQRQGQTGSGRDSQIRPVTILVTGFAHFDDIGPFNPSAKIVSLLPSSLPTIPAYPTPVNILCHPYPIRVSYGETRALVPRLYDAYQDSVDIVLHIGVAPSQQHYSLERSAHRDGYDQHGDIDDKTLDGDDGSRYWPDSPEVLSTSLDYEAVYDAWRSNLLRTPEVSPELDGVVVRRSEDAGHFICDFIYYSMLAEYHKRRAKSKHIMEQRPVIFLHVPGQSAPADVRRGRLVTMALIRSLADCWMPSKE